MEVDQERALGVARELTAACSALLGSRLVAAILHGSLVLGDYRSESSDVDLLVVVEAGLSDTELDGLEQLVDERIAEGRIDFRVVTRAVVSTPTPRPAMEFYLGRHGPGAHEVLRRTTEQDLVAEFSMARAFGRSLIGCEPPSLIAQVPDTWIDAYGDEILARWQRLTDDAENAALMVLTSCRIWRYAVERVYCSKLDAGRWARERAPGMSAIADALRQRAGGAAVKIAPVDVGELLSHVRSELGPVVSPSPVRWGRARSHLVDESAAN